MTKNLAELRNIGPTIEHRLHEIGVHTRADLKKVGPVNAYLRVCASDSADEESEMASDHKRCVP